MTRSLSLFLAFFALASAHPACAADEPQARTIAPPKRIPESVEVPVAPAGEPVTTASMPREVRRAVVADAARRFKVPESAVVLTRAERLTWSDGSLGCPEPGQTYVQMLVPGFRVVAKTREGELTYNTDTRGNAKTCGVIPAKSARKLADKVSGSTDPAATPAPQRQSER
jgi:hypothetical protein